MMGQRAPAKVFFAPCPLWCANTRAVFFLRKIVTYDTIKGKEANNMNQNLVIATLIINLATLSLQLLLLIAMIALR